MLIRKEQLAFFPEQQASSNGLRLTTFPQEQSIDAVEEAADKLRPVLMIGKEQFAFLTEQQSNSYELRLTKFLQEQFTDAAEELTDKLRSEVSAQIGKARGYGLLSEQEVASYVISAWLMGRNFDAVPAVQKVLAAQTSPGMKARFLEQWTNQVFEELAGGT